MTDPDTQRAQEEEHARRLAAARARGRMAQAGRRLGGRAMGVAGRGLKTAGRGMAAGGRALTRAGAGLSRTGWGAIAGVPLAAAGIGMRAAGAGARLGGRGLQAGGQAIAGKEDKKGGLLGKLLAARIKWRLLLRILTCPSCCSCSCLFWLGIILLIAAAVLYFIEETPIIGPIIKKMLGV